MYRWSNENCIPFIPLLKNKYCYARRNFHHFSSLFRQHTLLWTFHHACSTLFFLALRFLYWFLFNINNTKKTPNCFIYLISKLWSVNQIQIPGDEIKFLSQFLRDWRMLVKWKDPMGKWNEHHHDTARERENWIKRTCWQCIYKLLVQLSTHYNMKQLEYYRIEDQHQSKAESESVKERRWWKMDKFKEM